MKLLIVLTVIAVVAANPAHLSKEQLAKLDEIKEKCVKETGAAADVLDKLFAGDFSNEDRPTKCFAKCFYQNVGFFDKDDNLDVKATIARIGEDFGVEKAEKWVTPCKDIDHKDPCDKAFEIFRCFHKEKQPTA